MVNQMGKPIIKNKTHWDGRALRKLCIKAIKNKGSHKTHWITIDYNKSLRYRGKAVIYGSDIWMYVPRPTRSWKWNVPRTLGFDPVRFCRVLEHEIDHNLGLRHKDMIMDISMLNCDYAKDVYVSARIKQPKAKPDLVMQRYQRAVANLKTARTRYKRATTLLKKWESKVRYYKKKNLGEGTPRVNG